MADAYAWVREESRDASRCAVEVDDAPTLRELLADDAVCEACGGYGALDVPDDDGCCYAAICLDCTEVVDL